MRKEESLAKPVEQACASMTAMLKDQRLMSRDVQCSSLKIRMNAAKLTLTETQKLVNEVIDTNRGGRTGMHGFIGERMQVGVCNARSAFAGLPTQYRLVDNNSMTDYYRGTIQIQQKACISDKALGLTHIAEHSLKYPEFKGVYQIPRDFYNSYKRYSSMPTCEAGKLRMPEYRLWLQVKRFNADHPTVKIEPMALSYDEIQAGTAHTTLANEEKKLMNRYVKENRDIMQAAQPSIAEGLKCTTVSASIEGLLGGLIALYKVTKKEDKKIEDLNSDNWKEIGTATLKAASKGAVRGASVYCLTNYANVPAHWACAATSATMNTLEYIYNYRQGEMTGEECALSIVENITDTMICASCAKLGERIIPIPIVGNFIGGFSGLLIWSMAKSRIRSNYTSYAFV